MILTLLAASLVLNILSFAAILELTRAEDGREMDTWLRERFAELHALEQITSDNPVKR